MQFKKYYYLVRFQYLGFRYHGWQRQPKVKTVQLMIEKTLSFVLQHDDYKVLAASRTDMMVSAHEAAFELFLKEPMDSDVLQSQLNFSLPSDLRILSIEQVSSSFNILQDSKQKEYLYLFSSGEKIHPFCAPFMQGYKEQLDIALMQKGARIFEGEHNFQRYAYKPSENTNFIREIFLSEVVPNTIYTANFFPKNSYIFRVKGNGFMRYQVRLMMGILYQLGAGIVNLSYLKDTLNNPSSETLKELAPASGLQLYAIDFEKK